MSEKSTSTPDEKNTDNSTPAVMFTIVLYILYFMFIKPVLTISDLDNPEKYSQVVKNTYSSTGILLVLVIMLQLGFNTSGYQAKCPGTFSQNFGKVFAATFIPWVIIMGSVMIALIAFPGFKGAFSNVFGYYAVANSSNDILVELLGNSDTDAKIAQIGDDASEEAKTKLASASDAVLKIVGNTSLMVNQITPTGFIDFWNMLMPIMKEEYRSPAAHQDLKEKLLGNVILKDNIGEVCWYIYTTILLITVVKTNLADLPCSTSVAAIRERTAAYDKKQTVIDAAKKKQESVTYVN